MSYLANLRNFFLLDFSNPLSETFAINNSASFHINISLFAREMAQKKIEEAYH